MKRRRAGARVVLLRPDGMFLLFHFKYDCGPLAGTEYWGLPGGGVEAGETVFDAAVRELREETGLVIDHPGPVRAEAEYAFRLSSGEDVVQCDSYFVHRLDGEIMLSREGFTAEESQSMVEARWWSLEEVRSAHTPFSPPELAAALARAGVR